MNKIMTVLNIQICFVGANRRYIFYSDVHFLCVPPSRATYCIDKGEICRVMVEELMWCIY